MLWTIFAKSSILDVWQDSEYASDLKHLDKQCLTELNNRYIVL